MDRFIDLVTSWAPALAAAASLVGIFLAVEQLTVVARARRNAEWASGAIKESDSDKRKSVLLRIKLEAESRAVAGTFVPGRHFVESLLWIGFLLFIAFFAALDSPLSSEVLLPILALGAAAPTFRRGVRVYSERERLRNEYLDESTTPLEYPKLGMLDQVEGGARREYVYALALALGVALFGWGAGVVVGSQAVWGFTVSAVGLGIWVSGIRRLRKRVKDLVRRKSTERMRSKED